MSECLNVILKFYQDNDRMIETVERINDSYLEMLDALEVLEADNAKLRELCADMHAVISDRNSWWDCMCKDTRRFADRMRELGIEAGQ